jgi:predicted RNA-binding Zn-ribbon protein involved in translation (DUF1610 family)
MNFPCPLCREQRPLRINRKNKPYFRCEDCGVLMFINDPKGIRHLETYRKPASPNVQNTLGSFLD